MNNYEILTKAQNLIRDPAKLTRGAFARDNKGGEVHPRRPGANCWCSLGAIIRVAGIHLDTESHPTFTLLGLAIDDTSSDAVPDFNDNSEHSAVMAMFDRARELALA